MFRFPIACLIATVVLSVVALPALRAAGPPDRGIAELSPGFFRTSFNGNVSMAGPGPNASVPVQSNLTIRFEIQDPTWDPHLAGLFVKFPQPAATFNLSTGAQTYFLGGKTVPITSANWSDPANTTYSILLGQATTFASPSNAPLRAAILSSQTLALTSPLPFGSLTVYVRWSWTVTPSIGQLAHNTSGWLPSDAGVPVRPDQYAILASSTGNSVSPGGSYTACLDGAIAGRTFSLHAETIRPLDDFVQSNATVPMDQSSPYCLTIRIPSYVAPQPLLVHLWDYANGSGGQSVTLLLYNLKVNLVPASPPPLAWYSNPIYLGLGGALGVLGVAAWALGRQRRRRRPGRPSPGSARAVRPAPVPPPGATRDFERGAAGPSRPPSPPPR